MNAAINKIAKSAGWNFDTSYVKLPAVFYAHVKPTAVAMPQLVIFNRPLATSLGLDAELLAQGESALIFAGNVMPEGATPLAQAYAGHQFGHFTMLGDGRAILLGEHVTPASMRWDGDKEAIGSAALTAGLGSREPCASMRWDIQLKGSGQTQFSRRGDGRAALGPMLREYIISEAMHALGVPTTRSLAVIATGEPVYRESTLPGAILTRVAASHIRVGTFEFAAAQAASNGSHAPTGALVQALADYTIDRHYAHIAMAENRYLAFFEAVAERQAELIARWQSLGFIHGVMNTDNMAISGETIDYGPCAFMDAFDPATVFSSIDHQGRYAFGNQPRIASWNLARFAETLLALFDADEQRALALGQQALQKFAERFNFHYMAIMRAKLGLTSEQEGDAELITALLTLMQEHKADYTNTLRTLSYGIPEQAAAPMGMDFHSLGTEQLFAAADFHSWAERWQKRLTAQNLPLNEVYAQMRKVNPAVIPRNHKVEEALAAASAGDLSPMNYLLDVLTNPFEAESVRREFLQPAPANGEPYRTFCGT